MYPRQKFQLPNPALRGTRPRSRNSRKASTLWLGFHKSHADHPLAADGHMSEGEKGCGGCHKIGDTTLTEVLELRENGSGTEFGAAMT